MGCTKGRVASTEHTKLRLFADSGGFCQNPECVQPLFLEPGSEKIHIAEMAHIAAASDHGPRADAAMSDAERAEYANLILLCPRCHAIIDKAPAAYPDALVQEWKRAHRERLESAFGGAAYPSRDAARAALMPLLAENLMIIQTYGPSLDYRFNPESEMAGLWHRKVLTKILPNNRRLLAILDRNRAFLTQAEVEILEAFRQHVDDLEARHLGLGPHHPGTRFPEGMRAIFGN